MAETYLDQLVDYPAKIMQRISSDEHCTGFLVNKNSDEVTEDDFERVLEEKIFDYQYVDDTAEETSAYIWVEAEVAKVENSTIKEMHLYITVVCHKRFMKLNQDVYKGTIGNRRDNLVRYIDKLLNGKSIAGIGGFKLKNVRTVGVSESNFTARQISYEISDFNLVDITK